MSDFVFSLDYSLFLAINHLPHGVILDTLAILASAGSGFIWFFLIALGLVIGNRFVGRKALVGILLAGLLTHLIVVVILKPIFARPRPDLVELNVIKVETQIDSLISPLNSNDYSFPSGHATMAAAAAFILTKLRRKQALWWFFLASAISFSRIYLGKHYLSDVAVGAVLGWGIGWLIWRAQHLNRVGKRLELDKK